MGGTGLDRRNARHLAYDPTLLRHGGNRKETIGFGLDRNEQYCTIAKFREHWEAYLAEPELCDFLSPAHLIFVEQPMYRNDALKEGLVSMKLPDFGTHANTSEDTFRFSSDKALVPFRAPAIYPSGSSRGWTNRACACRSG